MRIFESKSLRAVAVIVSSGLIIVCFAAGLIKYANDAVLRQQGYTVAKDWAEQLNEKLSGIDQGLEQALSEEAIRRITTKASDTAHLSSVRLYSLDGKLLFGWTDPTVLHNIDKHNENAGITKAAAGMSVISIDHVSNSGALSVYSDSFIPVFSKGRIVGLWHFRIDETDKAEAFKEVFQFVAGMLLFLTFFVSVSLGVIFVSRIRHQERIENHARFLALHDTTTGLHNRKHFDETLEALGRSPGKLNNSALYWLDIDGFSGINDNYGRAAGDAIIKQIADDIIVATDDTDFAARVGGDQFAVLRRNVKSADDAVDFARQLIGAIKRAHDFRGKTIPANVSVGVKFTGEENIPTDEILRASKLAMYGARSNADANYCIYSDDLEAELLKKKELETELRAAMQDMSQFELYYQPQVELSTGELKGYEALIRWHHPERGLIPPIEFIPIAESVGLIVHLGRWVLTQACADAATWDDNLRVAVNISPLQFKHDDLATRVRQILEETSLAPDRLELEITESLLFDNPEEAMKMLTAIKATGVSIAMDDFGTGFSCLKHLWQFPFDKIKIDQSFVRNIGANPKVDSIISSTVQLGAMLGVKITAEGVETAEQAAFLRHLDCDLGQGYLYGRPEPLEESAEVFVHGISTERLREIVRRSKVETVEDDLPEEKGYLRLQAV